MRRFVSFIIILFLSSSASRAGIWLDNLTIPEEINHLSSTSELSLYLDGDTAPYASNEAKRFYQLAAIRKIGQLKEPAAFEILKQEYIKHADELKTPSPEKIPYYRKHIIDAMAELDSGESRSFIGTELELLLKTGPRIQASEQYKRKYAGVDAYYVIMSTTMLKIIGKWDDEKSKAILDQVCNRYQYPWIVREAAFHGKYLREIKIQNIDQDKIKITDFLLKELTGPGEGSKSDFTSDGKTTESLKNSGIMSIIYELGPDNLSYLEFKKKEFERDHHDKKIECVNLAVNHIKQNQSNKNYAEQTWKKLK